MSSGCVPSQITPEPSFPEAQDELDNDIAINEAQLFTQESGTKLLFEDASVDSETSHLPRNYYEQLFSSDSEDFEIFDSDRHPQNGSMNQLKSHPLEIEDLSTFPIEYKDELLGFNQPIPTIMAQESSPESHT